MIHWHTLPAILAGALIALGLFAHFACGMASSGADPKEVKTANRLLMAGVVLIGLIWAT